MISKMISKMIPKMIPKIIPKMIAVINGMRSVVISATQV
jgi:hypothetical protein